MYNGVWDSIINNLANIAIGAPDTLLDGGGIDYTEIGAIRWSFAIAPDHPLAFMPEPISESQLRLYPNIMVEDTAHTINKKVGWLLHGQESILVPDFNTKCQCQILGEGIGFYRTIWYAKRWKSRCWSRGRSTTRVRIHACCWQPSTQQPVA